MLSEYSCSFVSDDRRNMYAYNGVQISPMYVQFIIMHMRRCKLRRMRDFVDIYLVLPIILLHMPLVLPREADQGCSGRAQRGIGPARMRLRFDST